MLPAIVRAKTKLPSLRSRRETLMTLDGRELTGSDAAKIKKLAAKNPMIAEALKTQTISQRPTERDIVQKKMESIKEKMKPDSQGKRLILVDPFSDGTILKEWVKKFIFTGSSDYIPASVTGKKELVILFEEMILNLKVGKDVPHSVYYIINSLRKRHDTFRKDPNNQLGEKLRTIGLGELEPVFMKESRSDRVKKAIGRHMSKNPGIYKRMHLKFMKSLTIRELGQAVIRINKAKNAFRSTIAEGSTRHVFGDLSVPDGGSQRFTLPPLKER